LPTSTPSLDWHSAFPTYLGENWQAGLEERKQEEATFHDEYREGGRDEALAEPNQRYYDAMPEIGPLINSWIDTHAPGRTFLDYACGHGIGALRAAKAGASLAIGIDLSATSIETANQKAKAQGLADRCRFLQRDGEETGFPSSVFDLGFCAGVLHHVDLSRAMPEIHRLMAPGGRVFCGEALGHNPVFQFYRRATPKLRTAFEVDHILTLPRIRSMERWFSVENIQFHGLLAVAPAALPKGTPGRSALISAAILADRVLTKIPGLRRMSWVVTFELVKR
jgi:SAM-dependent methyltransferase